MPAGKQAAVLYTIAMSRMLTTIIGKVIQNVLHLFKGNAQSLPGLVIERISPQYITTMLGQLPQGVVLVTGTNGKTTTVKMVVELLAAQRLRVLTNPSGSNLTRGLVSCVLHNARWSGELPFDIAVLEIDEGYAKQLVTQVRPRYVLALNVSRDQLDRFGEVDAVAKLLEVPLRAAQEGVVVNADDPYLVAIANDLQVSGKVSVSTFGVSSNLRSVFPHDSALASVGSAVATMASASREKTPTIKPEVLLDSFTDDEVTYRVAGRSYDVHLRISGQHNYQNAAAALVLVRHLLPHVPMEKHIHTLTRISEAFGRGQVYTLPDGRQVKLVLVKNPAGFMQALASFAKPGKSFIIAINDNYADSRDVSWLWDVDFSSMPGKAVSVAAGSRGADMALRLSYDDIAVQEVVPVLPDVLERLTSGNKDTVIFATYTAMMELHGLLERQVSEGIYEAA